MLFLLPATGTSFTLQANALDTINDEQNGVITATGGTIVVHGSAYLISDGNHHWYTLYHN
jgi:hypothetical protein